MPIGARPNLKPTPLSGYTAYVLHQPASVKVHARAHEGVLIEILEHRLCRVVVRRDDSLDIITSRRVTFDKISFCEAAKIHRMLDTRKSESNSDYDIDNLFEVSLSSSSIKLDEDQTSGSDD